VTGGAQEREGEAQAEDLAGSKVLSEVKVSDDPPA
jgi:hypothetical protein